MITQKITWRILSTLALCALLKGDSCSQLDLCKSSWVEPFRTCSCDDDCYKYNICCLDADNVTSPFAHEYECYDHKMVTPVFVKRRCADDFKGDARHARACATTKSNERDLFNNILVTSSQSRITYWNKDCAICNHEKMLHLKPWTVQMTCPKVYQSDNNSLVTIVKITESDILVNLAFEASRKQWGVVVVGEFVPCSTRLYQPALFTGYLKYCAPNLVANCPTSYQDNEIASLCTDYHGERRLRLTNRYFKNVHCAVCNGVSVNQMDCVGRNYAPPPTKTTGNVKKVIIEEWNWTEILGPEKFSCHSLFSADSSSPICKKPYTATASLMNSAPVGCTELFILVIFTIFFHFWKHKYL